MDEHQSSRKPGRWGNLASAWPLALLLVVGLCALSFYGGLKYEQGQKATPQSASAAMTPGGGTGSGGGFGAGGRRFGGRRGVIGTVAAISASSITVTPSNGGAATTLAITSSTQITSDGQTASASDITSGETVLVTPSASDSSQAARILINPSFGGASGAAPSPSGNSTNLD